MTARLKVDRKKQLTLVSVNAPTFRASVSDKENFFHDMQLVIDGMASDDILVVMGDWNAHVGSIGGDSVGWSFGTPGVGAMNEAGMSFCVLNELFVVFEKSTSSHGSTQAPNLALHMLMTQGQTRRCHDGGCSMLYRS